MEDKIDLLDKLINTDGWKRGIVPHLTNQLNMDIVALVGNDPEKKTSDDFLRGRISLLKWLIEGIPREIQEVKFERMRARQPEPGQPAAGDPYQAEQEK